MQCITIRVTKELHQKLKEEARRKGLTLNALIVTCLLDFYEIERR